MASTEQKKKLLKAKIAVALHDELGRVPKKEEIEQVFLLSRVMYQGDRTILTRPLILSHSAFSAASTTTPHERRRAQVRAPKPVWANRAMTLFAPVCTYVDRVRSGKVLQYQ